jgi:Fur family ferric uptake transcriptional regulator
MSCEKVFLEKLHAAGFRLTPQREIVLSVLHKMDGPAPVEDLYREVQRISAAVDISTIYRTLDLLQKFDLAMAVEPGDGQRLYKLLGTEGPHMHLICKECGAVIGIETSPAEPLASYLLEHYGFELDIDHLSLPGLCEDCRSHSE